MVKLKIIKLYKSLKSILFIKYKIHIQNTKYKTNTINANTNTNANTKFY